MLCKKSLSIYVGIGLIALFAAVAILVSDSKFNDSNIRTLLKRSLREYLADITPVTAAAYASRPIVYVPIIPGATIPILTGSATGIVGPDTNPAHYRQYNAPGGSGAGYGLIGGPLINDLEATSFVKATEKSDPETGPNGPVIALDNNYFNSMASTAPDAYLSQLRAFHAGYAGSSWRAEAERIDGACPLAHPTTAEVLQWAANKWGINPILMYAEATVESGWDQTGIGDNGRSSGVLQIADRGDYHAFAGFTGSGSMLARENTCFNADFYAAHLYSAFHGLTGETTAGDIGRALQSWYSGSVSSPGPYTASVYDALKNRSWVTHQFGGKPVPF
jgi:hypothetical protein